MYFFAINVNPRFPVIVAGNRDEFLERGSKAAHFWPSPPDMLAGRDERDGGTWMGVNRKGRWALLTNFRDPSSVRADRPSRGGLVTDFLCGEKPPEEWLLCVEKEAAQYNPFNLVAASGADIFWFSSRLTGVRRLGDSVPKGWSPFSTCWLTRKPRRTTNCRIRAWGSISSGFCRRFS
ncbi:MAG: NRDE family protein [Deltaproteobacteria bacterium]|nr:NRDE family protein [Deltaproteobacteria bacterium]